LVTQGPGTGKPYGNTNNFQIPSTKFQIEHFFVFCDLRFDAFTIVISQAGHINASSGLGEWQMGLDLLRKLDSQP
jgi:hypothetical protein